MREAGADDGGGRSMTSIALIQRATAAYFGVTTADLTGPTRLRHIVTARWLAMLIVRQRLGNSLPRIGRAFGGRDHTAVMHGIRQAAEWVSEPGEYASAKSVIEAACGCAPPVLDHRPSGQTYPAATVEPLP